MGTITSANSVVTLSIDGLYPSPQQLQGYAADRAFETDAVENSELVLGVDGNLSSGWVPHLTRQTYMIMPDSLSSDIFENWLQTEDANRNKLPAQGIILLPSISKKYSLYNGFLTSLTPVPGAARVLEARRFIITWNKVTVAPI